MDLNIPKLCTVTQVSDALHVSKTTVIRWINEGKISAYQLGNRGDYRIDIDNLNKAINESKVEPVNG